MDIEATIVSIAERKLRAQYPDATLERDVLATLTMPVLVVAGRHDDLAGDPEELARVFPRGKGVTLPGCDHFSAIPHGLLKATVFDFLDGLLDDDLPDNYR